MEKEAVGPVESRSGQEYTDASSHCREKFDVLQVQRETKVARNAGHDKKRSFKYMKGKKPHCRNDIEIILFPSGVWMVTSQTGTETQ